MYVMSYCNDGLSRTGVDNYALVYVCIELCNVYVRADVEDVFSQAAGHLMRYAKLRNALTVYCITSQGSV